MKRYIYLIVILFLLQISCGGKKKIKNNSRQYEVQREEIEDSINNDDFLNMNCECNVVDIKSRARKLDSLYYLLSSNYSKDLELEFFKEFPDCFERFVKIYGYKEGANSFEEGYLFGEVGHINDVFCQLKYVKDTTFYQRLIEVSIGGYWQSDGVNFLKHCLFKKLRTNLNLSAYLLNKYRDEDIESFWYFYFDGPHPKEDIPDELKMLKLDHKRIYILMLKAHQKVIIDRNDH